MALLAFRLATGFKFGRFSVSFVRWSKITWIRTDRSCRTTSMRARIAMARPRSRSLDGLRLLIRRCFIVLRGYLLATERDRSGMRQTFVVILLDWWQEMERDSKEVEQSERHDSKQSSDIEFVRRRISIDDTVLSRRSKKNVVDGARKADEQLFLLWSESRHCLSSNTWNLSTATVWSHSEEEHPSLSVERNHRSANVSLSIRSKRDNWWDQLGEDEYG